MNIKSTKRVRKGAKVTRIDHPEDIVSGVKALVCRFSRGNVNLQIGRYASQKEINSRRKAVTDFDYAD